MRCKAGGIKLGLSKQQVSANKFGWWTVNAIRSVLSQIACEAQYIVARKKLLIPHVVFENIIATEPI